MNSYCAQHYLVINLVFDEWMESQVTILGDWMINKDGGLHDTFLMENSEELPWAGWSPKRNSSQGSQGISRYPKARSEESLETQGSASFCLCFGFKPLSVLLSPPFFFPQGPRLSLTSVHLWFSNVSCCPFRTLSDIGPCRVHIGQTELTPKPDQFIQYIF